jgi:hypothetical protein
MTIETPLYYEDVSGNEFVVLAVYNPNEEPDPWVRYENIQTEQEYTCRLEAFQSRFRLITNR